MAQNNNILQELNQLNSSLADVAAQNVYTAPAGYFDGLATRMLNRIRAMEATNAVDETNFLSPMLNVISRKMPYVVPDAYFEVLAEQALQSVRKSSDQQTANEEIESLSPLLSGLKKQMPYSVPQGYFDTLSERPVKKETKVISIVHRKWFRYAAAAVVVGIMVIAGFAYLNNKGKTQSGESLAWLKKDLKKMNETDKDNLIEYLDGGVMAQINVDSKSQEVKELLKDVSDQELKDFQQQTEDVQDVLMTN